MSYHHFTSNERAKIEQLNQIGFSTRKIASYLKCHHSSIARELKRCSVSFEYNAQQAQCDYNEKRQRSKWININKVDRKKFS